MSNKLPNYRIFLFSLALTCCSYSYAGEIPGIPAVQPPSLMGDFQVQLSNDLLSLVNNADDYRTQQTGISYVLSPEWLIAVDHSILTIRNFHPDLLTPSGTGGRLDQISASLGYTLYRDHDTDTDEFNQLLVGGGFRSYGNYQGSRLQNGIHRLFDSDLVNLPYVSTQRFDAVIWLRGSREAFFFNEHNTRQGTNWKSGYWFDGTVLQTTDGQTDGTLGLYSLSRNRGLDIWFGLRGDWREGYDRDFVQQITAQNERGLSFAAGLSYGPIRIETFEGLGTNDNSFGRIVFTANRDKRIATDQGQSNLAYQLSFLLPEAAAQHQLRWLPESWNRGSSDDYRLYAVFNYRSATPAINDEPTRFALSDQYVIGVEVAENQGKYENWFSPYLMLGAGYRTEMIEGQYGLAGQNSVQVGSGVVVLDIGARFNMAGESNRWLVQFQLGATGWLPFSERQVAFDNQTETLLGPGMSLIMGVSTSVLF